METQFLEAKQKTIKNVYVFFIVMFSLNFFSAKITQTGLVKYFEFTYLVIAILISFPYCFRKRNGLFLPVQIISLSILFSVVASYITWGQSILLSLSTIPYLVWFIFFYLKKIKYPIKNIEIIVIIYGFIYVLLYFFQFFNNEVVYFGFKDEFIEDRGVIRINFPGGGVFFLSYFISLNKIFEKNKYKWIFCIFLMLGIVVTLLQVTRQNIILLLFITFFHIIIKLPKIKKMIAIIVFSLLTVLFINSDNSISKGLLEVQNETVSEGSQYIRVVAGKFFLSNFSPNILSKIFGNGLPNNTSEYGKYTTYLEDVYGYYLTDVGLVGFYVMFGIFSVAAYIVIFYKCLIKSIPENYYYLKYYIILLIVTSLTSDFCFSINFLITNIFVIYCYQLMYEKEQFSLIKFYTNKHS